MSAMVLYFALSAQRAIGVLPDFSTGVENSAVFARSVVTVMPPIAMSYAPDCSPLIRVGQLVGTISSFTPSAFARLAAMSTSSPSNVPAPSLMLNGL